jgi:hypothetical protein
MKILTFFIIAILFLGMAFTPSALGQTDEVLVAGKPPLTQENAKAIIKYYERGLNIEFTAEQSDELQTKIVNQWRRVQKIDGKSLTEFLASVTRINAWVKLNAKSSKTNCAKACLVI